MTSTAKCVNFSWLWFFCAGLNSTVHPAMFQSPFFGILKSKEANANGFSIFSFGQERPQKALTNLPNFFNPKQISCHISLAESSKSFQMCRNPSVVHLSCVCKLLDPPPRQSKTQRTTNQFVV